MNGRHERGDAPQEVNLPITPMLDMAFQLLMYFILTYHPSAMEGQMDLASPQANNPPIIDAPPDPIGRADKEDVDIPLDLNVRVQAQQVGYTVTLEEGVVRTPMANLAALSSHLEKVFKEKATAISDKLKGVEGKNRDATLKDELKKVAIKVQGDSNLAMESVIEVMDACRLAGSRAFKEAGFEVKKLNVFSVSLAGPPDLGIGQ